MYVIPEQALIPTDRILVSRSLLRNFNPQMVCWLEDQSKAKVELMRLLPGDTDLEIRIKGPEPALNTARSLIEQVRETCVQRQEAQQQLISKQQEQAEKEQRDLVAETMVAEAQPAATVCLATQEGSVCF